jgi:hypothetical protein
MTPPEPRIIKDGLAYTTWHNLCIGLWREQATVAAADELGRQYRTMARTHPSGFAVLVIVEATVGIPDDPSRRAISDAMKDVGKQVLAMCGVQEATGFRGAAIRGAITAMVMMSRVPYKTTTVASVESASQWLAPFIVPTVTAGTLASAVGFFRSRLPEMTPDVRREAANR